MEPRLPGGLHIIRQADRLAQAVEHLRRANHVAKGRLLRVQIEHAPVRLLERADATRPDVQRDRPQVGDVLQRQVVVADEIANVALRFFAPDADGADPLRRELRGVRLVERFPIDTVGDSRHDERTIAQVRQQPGGDCLVILDQVALRVSLLGPVDLLEVREVDRFARAVIPREPVRYAQGRLRDRGICT